MYPELDQLAQLHAAERIREAQERRMARAAADKNRRDAGARSRLVLRRLVLIVRRQAA